MTMRLVTGLVFLIVAFVAGGLLAQVADGENEYYLAGVNSRFLAPGDTIDGNAGRGVWVAAEPDLDGDGRPEILVTEYSQGGRIFVFEVIGDNTMEYVWGSKILSDSLSGGLSSPRSVTTGDFDNDGFQEVIFSVAASLADTTNERFANRGIYFYEHTGNDNDYGTEPARLLKFEEIDPAFATLSTGITESGLLVADVDDDGKNEFLYAPRSFNFAVAKLYILEVESGTFENNDAVIAVEYVYDDMVQPPFLAPDGYVPVGVAAGNVDLDPNTEIVVAGATNIGRGAGLGFIEVQGPDQYENGSIIEVGERGVNSWAVKAKPLILSVNGNPAIFLHGSSNDTSIRKLWVVDNIVDDTFVGQDNIKEVLNGLGIFSIWDDGDQDHGTGEDGFNLYLSSGLFIFDIEYNGVGELSSPSSYSVDTLDYNLGEVYDNTNGLFDEIFTFAGMDLDNDGARDLIASYKGDPSANDADGEVDTLGAQPFAKNTYAIFWFEWGSQDNFDIVTSTDGQPRPITIITPENYRLHQNYPNPFNPTTNISFELPINKTVSLKIYNSRGQEVRTLIDHQTYPPGLHTVQWDAADDSGNPVASGVYIYKLIFGNFSKSKTMTLVR